MQRLILTVLVLVIYATVSCQTHDGTGQKYIGIITSATGKTTQITLTFDAKTAKAYISSSLGLTNQEVSIKTNSADSLWFELSGFAVTYKGKYQNNKHSIIGVWQQSTKSLELRFERQSSSASPEQGLSSNKPNSSNERNVTIEVGSGITLGGTLTIPSGSGKYPALILLGVAGETDRDMSFGPYKSFKTIAARLATMGFVVLRCDDRGVGASKGSLYTSSYDDLVHDAEAMLTYLRQHPMVNPQKVGVWGISEGAALGGILAGNNAVAFAVLLSYPALKGDATMQQQISDLSTVYGFTKKQKDMVLEDFIAVETIIKTPKNKDSVQAEIRRYLEQQSAEMQGLSKYFMIPADPEQASKLYAGAWYRSQLDYTPSRYLNRITVPTLFLYGKNDPFVNPVYHTHELEKHLKQPRHAKTKVAVFENINHIFQDAATGSPLEYINNRNEFSARVLQDIEQWLQELMKQ